MLIKKIDKSEWINENTKGSKCVVELGAGFFNRLKSVNSNVKTKIGIEIYKPYIDNSYYHDCIKINGDILDYKELLKEYEFDTVMIIDVLEHLEKDVAFKLIADLKNDFNKILLDLPLGKYEQHEDTTGFDGHEYQTHRSYWFKEDIEKLKFNINVLDEYHHINSFRKDNNLDTGCYFGVWEKANKKT